MTYLTDQALAALDAAGFDFKDATATITIPGEWRTFRRMYNVIYIRVCDNGEFIREDVLRFIEAERRRATVKDSLAVQPEPEQTNLW